MLLPPAKGEQGANTSSSMDLSSWYSLHVVDISAYTDSRGEREKQRWSTFCKRGRDSGAEMIRERQ